MPIRCPKCRTPSLLSASEVSGAGRLVRCPACQTTWLARHFADDSYGGSGDRPREPAIRRQPRIIEGEIIPSVRFAAASSATASWAGAAATRSWTSRNGFAAGATVLVAMLVAVVLLTPAVSALPRLTGLFLADNGVVLEGVSSKTVKLRGTDAILVEGEIVNRSNREMEVPAVRIALKEEGSEVYTWMMEPTVLRLAAGQTVGFRSAMASPRPGAGQIALSLAERRQTGVGMR